MSKSKQPDEWLATLLPPRKFAHEPPLSGGPVTTGDALLEIPLASLDANPYQTRSALDEKSLHELADSIRSLGLLEPIVVRPKYGRYQVIAGERRVKACYLAGLHKVPAIVRDVSDEQAAEMTVIENLQREDINPMDEARAFRRLADEFHLTAPQIAERTGKSASAVNITLPQYFQGVLGTDAMGSGLRLLPLVGGLIVGAVPADRLARVLGAKITVALGFALVAAGMLLGATTAVGSADAFIAAWIALSGLGLGITFATAASAAISELSEERSGVGSAVMQALQKTGGPFGTAVLGSVLSSVYLSQLHLAGLLAPLASVVRQSLFGGIAVATRLHSPVLLSMVRGAFVDGMDVSLVVAAGIAAVGLLLTLAFLPSKKAMPKTSGVEAAKVAGLNPTGPLLVGAANEETAGEQ